MSHLFIFNGGAKTGKTILASFIGRQTLNGITMDSTNCRNIDLVFALENNCRNITLVWDNFSCVDNNKLSIQAEALIEFLGRKGVERRFENGVIKNMVIVTNNLTKELLDKLNEVAGRYLYISVCDFKQAKDWQ